MQSNIMFVDDSISVLESLRWIFKDEPYHIFLFDSPLKALSVIEAKDFAVVVADQLMTDIDGIEFLEQVKQKSPDTEGIIMYGFVEPETASNPTTHQFVKKPLDNDEIKQAVAIALARYGINIENRKESMPIFQHHTEISFQQQDIPI